MVITMDKDFGELVYNSGLPHAGVLLLRLEEAASDEKVKVIEKILEEHYKGINHRLLIWSFLSFEWWCKIFIDNKRVDEY